MNRSFLKMTGTGNDFIVIDDRDEDLARVTPERWASLCARRTGVGADGVLLLRNAESADFQMVYLNSDGVEAGERSSRSNLLRRVVGVFPRGSDPDRSGQSSSMPETVGITRSAGEVMS